MQYERPICICQSDCNEQLQHYKRQTSSHDFPVDGGIMFLYFSMSEDVIRTFRQNNIYSEAFVCLILTFLKLACIAVVPGWGRGYSARGSPVRELERGEWEEKGRERLPPAIVLLQYAPN